MKVQIGPTQGCAEWADVVFGACEFGDWLDFAPVSEARGLSGADVLDDDGLSAP